MISPYPEKTIYLEIDKSHGDMLVDDNYDAFVLIPLYLAMYHKQDLHICGNVSKKLYQNVKWYIQKILCDFANDLSPAKLTVDGFTSAKPKGNLIGTGISCGVDSLSTIYDHFVRETDPEYRINALFLFNCGAHGTFGDPLTYATFQGRSRRAVLAANELGLPVYLMNTNFHMFIHKNDATHTFKSGNDNTRLLFLASYSCILALQNAIFRYYMSGGVSYSEIKRFENLSRGDDLAEFCESYFVPLIQTERTELIVDGCQYRRVDKLQNISDWEIAQKYLNVCWGRVENAANCGRCPKCLRTLLPLEILGKLDKFSRVFNIEQYKMNSFAYKSHCLQNYGKDPFATENIDFAKEHNFPMPKKIEGFLLNGKVLF